MIKLLIWMPRACTPLLYLPSWGVTRRSVIGLVLDGDWGDLSWVSALPSGYTVPQSPWRQRGEEEMGLLSLHPSTAGSGTALWSRDVVERSECVCITKRDRVSVYMPADLCFVCTLPGWVGCKGLAKDLRKWGGRRRVAKPGHKYRQYDKKTGQEQTTEDGGKEERKLLGITYIQFGQKMSTGGIETLDSIKILKVNTAAVNSGAQAVGVNDVLRHWPTSIISLLQIYWANSQWHKLMYCVIHISPGGRSLCDLFCWSC